MVVGEERVFVMLWLVDQGVRSGGGVLGVWGVVA